MAPTDKKISNKAFFKNKAFTLSNAVKNIKESMSPNRLAFTLAEVLIVIGIIGMIADMTIPTLISSTKKQETSVRIKKFYSTMSQAISLSEIDNDSSYYWTYVESGSSTDARTFFNKYFANYLEYTKFDDNATVYFNDGSTVHLYLGGCVDLVFDSNGEKRPNEEAKDQFRFLFCSGSAAEAWFHSKDKTFGPYGIPSTREQALSSCQSNPAFCSALLSFDGWEFQSDYPWH